MNKIGIILISSDYTFIQESEFFCKETKFPGIFIYSIIPCDNIININSLIKLESKIKDSVSSFPKDINAITFACTCASVCLGPEIITNIIRCIYPDIPIITPITATLEAIKKLNVNKIAFVSPYIKEIEDIFMRYFEEKEISVTATYSFNESNDYNVSNISSSKIADAIFSVADDADAVFVSCTNLRFINCLEDIEKELGKPIISSNQVIIWNAMKLLMTPEAVNVAGKGYGTLFA